MPNRYLSGLVVRQFQRSFFIAETQTAGLHAIATHGDTTVAARAVKGEGLNGKIKFI